MSWLSKAVGKIPLVGHGLNEIGKFLPSGGQIAGGIALGPLGQVIGGRVDPNTSPTQRKIGDTVAATTGALGLGSLLGLPALGVAGAGKALGGLASGIGEHAGDIIDYGLGGANLYNAAKLGQKSEQYATDAANAVKGSYDERAPLRLAGIQGMLNPSAGNAAALSGVNAIRGPQIAAQPIPLPMTDPRLAMAQRVTGRNPFATAPLPLQGIR